ncbi:Thioredoxin [Alteribacillus persepolensis]|uniref:Thioredoxin n=2 Tax=Alteribacillus persepolensis TaxID=568899 RepID=A0A1G7ZB10_9BACI|nr:Thioredoxin [Alteribacillus persepolensis]
MVEDNETNVRKRIQSGERLLLFLYSPLCGTCKAAEKMLEPLEQVYRDTRFIKINVNVNRRIVEQEKVKSVPCLIVTENSQTVQKIYAFHSVSSLVYRLHYVLSSSRKDDSNDGS